MELQEREDLIFLQNAHVTQYTEKNGKSNWKVRKNITSEDLYELPGEWSEKQVFAALHFARDFELVAWNEGIQFGKNWNTTAFQQREDQFKKVIIELKEANERLSEKLGSLLGEEE